MNAIAPLAQLIRLLVSPRRDRFNGCYDFLAGLGRLAGTGQELADSLQHRFAGIVHVLQNFIQGLLLGSYFFLVSTSVYLLGIDEPDRLNPDHIVLMENVEDTAKSRLDELKSPALWKNIKAVQKDQVYIVEQQLWNRGIAPIGSTPIIDQVLKIVK